MICRDLEGRTIVDIRRMGLEDLIVSFGGELDGLSKQGQILVKTATNAQVPRRSAFLEDRTWRRRGGHKI